MPHPTPRARRAAAPLLLAGLAVAVLTSVGAARPVAPRLAAVIRAPGLTFTYAITSTSADKKKRDATDMTATVRMQDGNIRMDYAAGQAPPGQKDSYIVIAGDAKQMLIVNPKDKAVLAMDASMMGSGMGTMLNNPMMKVTMSNLSFRYKDMGAGEPMLGYKTRHVRLYNGSTMEVKVLGMTRRQTTSDSSDQWIAQGIETDDKTLMAWGRSFAAGVKGTNPELAAELERYQKEYARTGLALRTVTWSTITDEKGKATTDSVTMQVTDIRKGAIDASVFTIPADYTVTNVGEMMAAGKASMDSARKADAAGKDTTAALKPSAGDAIKAGLGGMFKKKKGG